MYFYSDYRRLFVTFFGVLIVAVCLNSNDISAKASSLVLAPKATSKSCDDLQELKDFVGQFCSIGGAVTHICGENIETKDADGKTLAQTKVKNELSQTLRSVIRQQSAEKQILHRITEKGKIEKFDSKSERLQSLDLEKVLSELARQKKISPEIMASKTTELAKALRFSDDGRYLEFPSVGSSANQKASPMDRILLDELFQSDTNTLPSKPKKAANDQAIEPHPYTPSDMQDRPLIWKAPPIQRKFLLDDFESKKLGRLKRSLNKKSFGISGTTKSQGPLASRLSNNKVASLGSSSNFFNDWRGRSVTGMKRYEAPFNGLSSFESFRSSFYFFSNENSSHDHFDLSQSATSSPTDAYKFTRAGEAGTVISKGDKTNPSNSQSQNLLDLIGRLYGRWSNRWNDQESKEETSLVRDTNDRIQRLADNLLKSLTDMSPSSYENPRHPESEERRIGRKVSPPHQTIDNHSSSQNDTPKSRPPKSKPSSHTFSSWDKIIFFFEARRRSKFE